MKPLKPEFLVKDLGTRSPISVSFVNALYRKLIDNEDVKVTAIFNEWKKHFEKVCGYTIEKPEFDLSQIEKSYRIESPCNFAKLLFSIHTYYALIVKLLAFKALYYYLTKQEVNLREFTSLQFDSLKAKLREIENGQIFRYFGIINLIEGDFFSWHLDVWDKEIASCVEKVIEILDSYTFALNNPAQDLLKKLYYDLIPRQIRHRLGEYYTPEWLAQLVIAETGFQGNPDFRLLDPGCGSGTFLVLLIRTIKEYADQHCLEKSYTLNKILNNVVGFDLNPLAVLTAKVNYLIALGDLLAHKKKWIRIPVYLCDSIVLPEEQQTLYGKVYTVQIPMGRFIVPVALVKKGLLEKFFFIFKRCIENARSFNDLKHELERRFDVIPEELLKSLYDQIINLKSDILWRVWLQLARDSFMPLLLGQFDYIVGNPSWINWDNLPEDYRHTVGRIYRKYGLIKRAPKVGAIKIDISILSTYVAIDKYLKNDGVLAFVITQTVFESRSAEGFRELKLFNEIPIGVLKVHDMIHLRPFEGAQNRTAVVVMKKGTETIYPVPYIVWEKKRDKVLESDETLDSVKQKISLNYLLAAHLSEDPKSPWAVGSESLHASLKRITKGQQYYKSREGVNTGGANAIYWVTIMQKLPSGNLLITNLSHVGRKKAPKLENIEVEPELIYPLIRGRDLKRWKVDFANIYIILPHTEATGMHALPEDEFKSIFPKTYRFFADPRVKSFLMSRRALIMRWGGSIKQWYSLFEVGPYTFSLYKVLYKGEVATDLVAAVASTISSDSLQSKIIIPDQTVHFIPMENPDEAYYVCALLNSSYVRTLYKSLRYKHPSTFLLEYINLPKFNRESELQREIAIVSRELHAATANYDTKAVTRLEAELNSLVSKLFSH